MSPWQRQLLEGASELLSKGKKAKDKGEGLAKEVELIQRCCFAEAWLLRALQMELEWLKKLSRCDARELRKLKALATLSFPHQRL